MSVQSAWIVAVMAVALALWLMTPLTANLLAIMPKKWRLWMLGEPPNGRSKRDGVVM